MSTPTKHNTFATQRLLAESRKALTNVEDIEIECVDTDAPEVGSITPQTRAPFGWGGKVFDILHRRHHVRALIAQLNTSAARTTRNTRN